jgi:hypothetical protein
MEKSKKMKSILALFVLAALFLWSFLTMTNYISDLENGIIERDSIIFKLNRLDSVHSEASKTYSEIITKYIDGCKFMLGDKELSNEDIVKITNELMNENRILKDSLYNQEIEITSKYNSELYKTLDSLNTIIKVFDHYKDEYGISYKINKEGNKKMLLKNITTVDSALILFPHYKHKISYDSLRNVWKTQVTIEREVLSKPIEKKKNKRNRK